MATTRAGAAKRKPAEGPAGAGDTKLDEKALEDLLAAFQSSVNGDFSTKLRARRTDIIGDLQRAFNQMQDRNAAMTRELGRVGRVVGREGRMTERASLGNVEGSWAESIESVNSLIDDLIRPSTEVALVMEAVARGDLNRKMALTIEGQPVKGEFARIGTTVNQMVDQLSSFADEVTRVAREVGTEGQLGGQAKVKGVSGTWKDLTDSVNGMAGNLTTQVRQIAQVTTAVANGDLSQKITVDARGEILELKNTINTMVDQLSSFADEVTRVAREVGTEGVLGGQAEVKGVSGTWRDLTESVNGMASNLTDQVRQIANVTTAVANGDLTQTVTVEARGEVAALADTINRMVDQLSSFAAEVTRVAREVGTEGVLGGQAEVKGVSGTWRDLTESVNGMASNLTDQVRQIANVTTAVANGDLTQTVTVEARGEVAALADTINSMVGTLSTFAEQVTGVAREVGTEGQLGGQADVPGAAGTWRDLTDSVNSMATNLTDQVRQIAQVTMAVANGDLTQKVTVETKGEVAALAETINSMVETLRTFAEQVTTVARDVGTEGELGGQADVPGAAGTWRDLTDSVNGMATNLTNQVRNIAQVTTAVANGDLSQKITVDARGEILELKRTMNTMVDQLSSFADEVTRVAREVGTEGVLGGQADVKGVSGTWRDLTESVNGMASNLTDQVRQIANVTTAVADGDLTRKVTVEARGEVAALADTINRMVDQLSSFAAEVTRVAREVGTEGVLGGQAEVEGVSGTWRDLTESVNGMASNLTDQVRSIAAVTTAVANGDLSGKITVEARGEVATLADTLNTMVDRLRSFAGEVTRVAREVGTEGKLGGQAEVEGVSGTWKALTESVNGMASNLTDQVRQIAQVTTAVADGDLTQKVTVEARGEVAQLADTINRMVDQLSSFADEVTRVAREVGTEGVLGGQADVKGVSGTWRDLTESVNGMASNLTDQVRSIASVTTAVADGRLTEKVTVEARGEVAALADTINRMVDQLSAFADEVTRVAREVGTEGQLGGQAEVAGVSGTWKALTESVNLLAGNLTTQVRAIKDVSAAVTQGDLTRQVTVEASGEVAELKDIVNQMIENLRVTTERNAQQDWLNSNLARISGLMQGQRDLNQVSRLIMSEVTPLVDAQHGAFFLSSRSNGSGDAESTDLSLIASYGYKERKSLSNRFKVGESLVGQAALEAKPIMIRRAPEDYIRVTSGLGDAAPDNIVVLPVLFEEQVMAVIELARFGQFSDVDQTFLEQLSETLGVVLNAIIANQRTEQLLEQSQELTRELQERSEELQSQQEELRRSNAELEEQAQSLKASEELLQTQQEELRQTNEELQEKAALLSQQNRDIELQNREIELARQSLEEQAKELAITSKYKSEFLANMSHELRTPLNSLLILSKLLSDNPERNLSDKQIEFARTIHQAGSDLLALISDILDLSKVEAGKMDIHPQTLPMADVRDYVERAFGSVAEEKGLTFKAELADDAPQSIITDEQRLQQIIRNLLSNAFKFTEEGEVDLRIGPAPADSPYEVAFTVRDTGIGIPEDKQRLIFEAFQQADSGTSRRYGGTGLGLNISREIASLLGGAITVTSTLGEGSEFTLLLPAIVEAPTLDDDEHDLPAADVIAEPGVTEPAIQPLMLEPAPSTVEEVPLEPPPLADTPLSTPIDDRSDLVAGDRVLLIVGGADWAEKARSAGFKVLLAQGGPAAIGLAQEYGPDAVLLDVDAESGVLDRLKAEPRTRHLPVLAVGGPANRQTALRAGAAAFVESEDEIEEPLADLVAFLDKPVRHVLVVEDDDEERTAVAELVGGEGIDVTAVGSAEDAMSELEGRRFDCIVLDLKLGGKATSGFQLLEKVKGDERHQQTPVIIHTGKALTRREETRLQRFAESIIVKDASSPERLLAETSLFLHRPESSLPEEDRRRLESMHQADSVLQGRTVLIVDDDVRNVFALTSALEARGMLVRFAENGREAIDQLKEDPDVDLVLMDVMMPEMDGYETTRAVRAMPQFEGLPIIALTAKAMKGDREKSIQSGASDYITKPVDVEQLLSLMRVWLYR